MKRKFGFIPVLLIFCLYILVNAHVLSGLQTLNDSVYLAAVFWSFIAALSMALFYSIRQMRIKGHNLFFKIISHTFLILIAAEAAFSVILLPGDLYRLIFLLISGFQHNGFHWMDRDMRWVNFALAISCIVIMLFIYGIRYGKYAYRVIKHTIYFDDLPKNFDGFTITQISDVHAGSFTNPRAVQKGIDMIQAQKSDLFVFTGDLVNNTASEIAPYVGHFSQIRAPFGQFSILGNHDYGDYIKWPSESAKKQNLMQLKAYHQQIGFRLLLDEHIELFKDGEKIILAGVENWGIGFGERGNLNDALAHTLQSDFKILLSHDPSHWDAQVKNYPSKVQLTLAGHTHGMQFGIEIFGIKWSPVQYRYKHWAGLKSENGRVLNINRGFGFLGFSGRIGIWPEITVIKLKSKAS